MVISSPDYKHHRGERIYLVNRLEASGGEIGGSSSGNSGGGSDLGLRGLDMIYD